MAALMSNIRHYSGYTCLLFTSATGEHMHMEHEKTDLPTFVPSCLPPATSLAANTLSMLYLWDSSLTGAFACFLV